MLIEGTISLKAVLKNDKRKVDCIYLAKNKTSKDIGYILSLAKQKHIPIKYVDSQKIAEYSKNCGGIIGFGQERKHDEFDQGDIFYLDGLQDPFNIGYACRTLYAFGFKNVYLSDRDYSDFAGQILKSSAGSYEYLNIKVMKDENQAICDLKEKGYKTYALFRGAGSKDVFAEKYLNKSLFIVGGEKRGISRQLLERCDQFLYIPYGSDFRNSLNVTAAVDVLATILFQQRRK